MRDQRDVQYRLRQVGCKKNKLHVRIFIFYEMNHIVEYNKTAFLDFLYIP